MLTGLPETPLIASGFLRVMNGAGRALVTGPPVTLFATHTVKQECRSLQRTLHLTHAFCYGRELSKVTYPTPAPSSRDCQSRYSPPDAPPALAGES
jgi:hypothetical protein